MTKIPFYCLLGGVVFTATAPAATNFLNSGGSILDPANWDNGLPAAGNQGTLAIDAQWPADNDLDGWDLVITGGTLSDASTTFSENEIYGGSSVDIRGGTWSRSAVVRLHGGAQVTVSGGTANIGGIAAISAASGGGQDGGFTLTVTAGSFVSNNVINFNNQENNSFINILGGSAVMGVGSSDTRAIDEANTFFFISGGSLEMSSLNMSGDLVNDNNITVTVSGGTLTTGSYSTQSTDGLVDQRYVNFPAGSTGSWTLTGADQATFEGFWAANTLLYDGGGGSGGGAFSDVFRVSGSTLSLIPEPGSALLALLGLLPLARRRRA